MCEAQAFTTRIVTNTVEIVRIDRDGERVFQARIPGAKDQPHVTIRTAGHFLQEDKPAELVQAIDGVISRQITKT